MTRVVERIFRFIIVGLDSFQHTFPETFVYVHNSLPQSNTWASSTDKANLFPDFIICLHFAGVRVVRSACLPSFLSISFTGASSIFDWDMASTSMSLCSV